MESDYHPGVLEYLLACAMCATIMLALLGALALCLHVRGIQPFWNDIATMPVSFGCGFLGGWWLFAIRHYCKRG